MDLLRNGFTTTVDYIERPLFYILRMSDFCYLHPSTAAGQRMAIDFCSFAKDVWERPQNNRAESSGIEGWRRDGWHVQMPDLASSPSRAVGFGWISEQNHCHVFAVGYLFWLGFSPFLAWLSSLNFFSASSYKLWSQAAPLPGPNLHLFLFTEGGKKPHHNICAASAVWNVQRYVFFHFSLMWLIFSLIQVVVSLFSPEYL